VANNLLRASIVLISIANVVGTPIVILNKDNYSYNGWNAIKDFDFSNAYFFSIYAYSLLSIIALIGFVSFFEFSFAKLKLVIFKSAKDTDLENFKSINKTKLLNNPTKYNTLFIFLMGISACLAIFMYINKIGILGVEPEPLPFKIIGILFYLRGYILPIFIFYMFNKTSQSTVLMFITVLISIIMGVFSASRGIGFIYLFPVIAVLLIRKITLFRIVISLFLILFCYMLTTIGRDIIYSSLDQSVSPGELLSGVFEGRSEFHSVDGLFVSLLNIVGTISNRLYGIQDQILAYQYILNEPWSSFGNFLLMEPIADIAKDLYGLEFLPGQGYGVGMGIIGTFVMIGRSDILLFIFGIVVYALIAVIVNQSLNLLFFYKNIKKYHNLYYMALFIAAFNYIQSTLSYLYFLVIFCFMLKFLMNKINFYYEK
jgi:hypothetical protein